MNLQTIPLFQEIDRAQPIITEGVGTDPKPDGIHPNVQGHRIVTENVWNVIGPIMQEKAL